MEKKKIIFLISLIIISIAFIIFVYNDYFLYKRPILKIDKIEEKKEESETTKEKYITQKIYGTIKNGEYKGKKVVATNHTTTSGVYDEQIHKGSELIIELSKDGKSVIGISQIKRDKYLAILFVIFIDLLLIIATKKGLLTLFSLIFNIVISFLSIIVFQKYFKHINMLWLYMFISIIFISLSLFITNGKGKKTLAAILSAIASLFVSFFSIYIIIKLYKNPVPYWTLEYIEAVHQYENFFYVSILLCGLGAIMDISITISSSTNELIEKDRNISFKNLNKSLKEISKDIVGTMSNVMLFTCFSSIIPMTFLMMKNNIVIGDAINRYGQVELIIVLTSCISIVLSIIISRYISVLIFKPKNKSKEVLK